MKTKVEINWMTLKIEGNRVKKKSIYNFFLCHWLFTWVLSFNHLIKSLKGVGSNWQNFISSNTFLQRGIILKNVFFSS